METRHFSHSCLYAILFSLLLVSCSSEKKPESQAEGRLGEIQLEVSGAAEAQPHFERGLLLLHSFEYADAADAFKQAQEVDPDFAMAYWGEAMTYNHSLWRAQDHEQGKAALEKLGATPKDRKAKALTTLEQDFLQAVEILYGEGIKTERDQAYADYMQTLYQKYPENTEVAAFYALSLLGSVPVGRDDEVYEKGATIAKSIIAENPNHPGALHYLIHSYDDPMHASLALHAADSYSKVAPDAAHALHMPSHIYVAMGMWDEVVASNEVSWQASVDRMKRKNLDYSAQSYHAFHWLLYGYLQQGRYAKARQIMDDMVRYTDTVPSKGSRAYLISMKGTYLIETNDWDNEIAEIEVDMDDLNISLRAIYFYLEGVKAYHKKDKSGLEEVIHTMEDERIQKTALITEKGLALCAGAGGMSDTPNQLDVDQAYVMELQLRGFLAGLEDHEEEAEKFLKQAAMLEENVSYSYGPPPIVKPSHELYGEWLLQTNHPEEAQVQFEKALERGPKRVLSLLGQKQAATLLNDSDKAKEANDLLQKIQQQADEEVRAQMKELQSALL
jgi:pentatricopeptide repeat protein